MSHYDEKERRALFVFILVFILMAGLPSLVGAQTPIEQTEYVVAIDVEYAPYEFVDASGKAAGFTVELLTEIGNQAGLTFRFVPMNWPDAVAGLDDGTVDLVNMIQTPERAQRYEFSEPHSQIVQAIFSTPSADITDLASLRGYRVALQQNDIALEKLADRTDFEKVIVHSKEEGFLMLDAGDVDAFLAAEQPGLALLQHYQLQQVNITAAGLFPQPFGFAARKGNTALITLLNEHLQSLKNSGAYDALTDQWLTRPAAQSHWLVRYQSQVLAVSLSLAVLAIALAAWTLLLRQVVRKRTQALRESEKQLQEAQTIARMGSYLFDFSAETWKSSAVLDRIFGIDENFERSTAGWAALIHPDDRQYMVDYLTREVIGNRARFDKEYRIIRNNDHVERWVHGLGELEFDAGGNLVSMLGTIQDITESKRAEEVIRRSDEKYRRVVETANEGIFFLDADTRITFTNQRMALMLGYTTEEMLGQKLESFLAEGPLSESSSQMKDRAQGMDEVYEQCFKTKDGGKHWTLMSPRAIFDSDGNLEGFFGMLTDIHERRQVEEKMRQLSRAVEQSPVSIVITDIHGVIQYVNPRFTHITGYTLEESLSQNPRMLKSGETTQEGYKQLWDTVLAGGEWRGEFHNRKKNGELYWESASISPVKDNSGRITHFLAVKEDITERKRTEEQLAAYAEHLGELVDERTRELRNAQEQLVRQERLALLGQVAGSIGHELRNPLGVISNAIYFLKLAQPNANDKVKEYLTIIENEARASDKIITDLLDFTRLRSVDREAVPVSDVIHETFERFPVPLDITVALDIPADLPKIFVDPHNLVQVLGNLTLNACQAMTSPASTSSNADQPRKGELTISAALQDNLVRMNVQDTGIGIPAENMAKLFEPLFTTKIKGIGLGLAVSKKLVEANGGRIEVKSEAGLGSTFTLWLPVAESSSRRVNERDPH
ncbi:MAG: PAS domain S-box protein [Chloroflexi bacterium]|nr:PAS domain S-box protein [Chloroflexota bacterium]